MPPVLVPALAAGASTALAGGFGAAVAAGSISAFAGGVSLAAVATSAGLAAASAGLQLATARKSGGIGPISSFVQRTPVFLPDVYGECRVGAAAAYYRQSTDASNNDLLTVWVLAAHAIEEVVEVRYGDALMWTPSGGLEAEFDGRATVAVQLGHDATPTPPADLLAGASGVLDSNFMLKGKPYVYIRFSKVTGRKTKWPQGIDPGRLWFRVKGKRVYDPRTEATAYSANWALCFRDWLISRGGLSAAHFSDAQIEAAATLCDEDVSLGGSPETFLKRYEVNGAFRSEIPCRDLIGDWLRQGGNLRGLVNTGAALHILPGAYTAPVASFGPDDFLDPVRLEPEAKVEDRFDGVQATFARRSAFFNASEGNRVILSDYTGDADDARILELEYARETRSARATRLGLLALRQSRRVQKISFSVPLTAANAALLPGQRVDAALAPAGIDGTFEIVERRTVLDPERPRVEIVALEDDLDFWSWTSATATTAPDGLSTTLPNPFFVQPVTGVTATGSRRVEPDGSVTRWIDVSWTAPAAEPFLDRYRVQWEQGGETRDAETTATRYRINNLASSGAVTITVFVVNTLGRESEGVSPGGTVTPTGDATPPGPPPSGAIFPVAGGFRFVVGNPTDADLAGLRLYEGASGAAFGATTAIRDIPATPGGEDTEFRREGIAADVTRRYFITAFDRTGNESSAFGPLEDTTPTALTTEEIDAAIAGAEATAAAAAADAAAALAAASANGTSITQLQTEATALEAAFLAGETTNALRNTDFTLGTEAATEADYWHLNGATAGYQWGRRAVNSIFSGPSDLDRPLFVRRLAGETDVSADLIATLQRKPPAASTVWGVPIQYRAGLRIEVSANIGTSNCEARLGLQFRDAANAVISNHYSAPTSGNVTGAPSLNPPHWVSQEVPVDAVRAVFFVNMLESTSGASDAFVTVFRPQLCESPAGATEPRPYAPGSSATVGAVDAYFRQDTGVLATDGLAVAQDVVSHGARLDDAEADITTIQTTKVDASGAVAAVSTVLNASSDGNVASVTALATAFSDGDTGAFDILTVKTDGAVARRTLGATENTSFMYFEANDVRFRSDRFQVLNPSGGAAKAIFTVAGGEVVIDGNLVLKGESVTTGKIGANAISKPYSASGSGNTGNIMTVVMDAPGTIIASVSRRVAFSNEGGTTTLTFRLLIDGAEVDSRTVSSGDVGRSDPGVGGEYITLGARRDVGSGNRIVRIQTSVSGGTNPTMTNGPFSAWALGRYR